MEANAGSIAPQEQGNADASIALELPHGTLTEQDSVNGLGNPWAKLMPSGKYYFQWDCRVIPRQWDL